MRVLILNTHEKMGGASIASKRLSVGLRNLGINSTMLVQQKNSDSPFVDSCFTRYGNILSILKFKLDRIPLQFHRKRRMDLFTSAIVPDSINKKIEVLNPDIIHLNWIGEGFLRVESLKKINKPIVWTLHDMWPLTGGCHYNDGCDRYKDSCGKCPQLGSQRQNDLSHWIWNRKKKYWKNLDITLVAPSRWIAKAANSSSLFKNCRVEVIPNELDTKLYKPIDKYSARRLWNLPENRKFILVCVMNSISDKRKGFQYLEPSLKKFATSYLSNKVELVFFGSSKRANPTYFGLKSHYLGSLTDDVSLVLLYSIADIFLAPSIQDNLPNTVMEALACGTPCVAFNIGGMPDLIEHERNGYLAKPYDTDDLASGIKFVLEDEDRWKAMSQRARQKVEEEFELNSIANRYVELYKEVLKVKDV